MVVKATLRYAAQGRASECLVIAVRTEQMDQRVVVRGGSVTREEAHGDAVAWIVTKCKVDSHGSGACRVAVAVQTVNHRLLGKPEE